MEEKIKKSLAFIQNIKFDVWFNEEVSCGAITFHHRCVPFTVLNLLTKVVDLVAISCSDINTYRIIFRQYRNERVTE